MGAHSLFVALAAAGSGLGAVATHAQPTGSPAADVVLALAVGSVAVVAASATRPIAWMGASGIALAATRPEWAGVAGAGVALSIHAISGPLIARRHLGALAGAAAVQCVLRQPTDRFGPAALASVLALGCLLGPAWAAMGPTAAARLRRGARVVGLLSALAVAGLGASILLARSDVAAGIGRAEDGLDAARDGEGDRAGELFEGAQRSFAAARDDLDAWWARPALLLPVIGQHARALTLVADAGADLSAAAATSSRQARVEDLTVVDGRLDLDRLRSMEEPLDEVRAALHDADATVARAASPWLVSPLAHRVRDFAIDIDEATYDASTAAQAVAVLPDLLGDSGTRHYLVAFGTPAETRELGGFMGAYAILRAEDGELSLDETGRVRDLNQGTRGRQFSDPSVIPDHLESLQPLRFWQNVTGTADFPTVAAAAYQMWPPTSDRPLDGVLYMDPQTLSALLGLTGPIVVPDYAEPLTEDNAAEFLERGQYVAFPDDDRHDFLVEAAETVFDELTSGELPGPRVIADVLAPSVRQRRLLMNGLRPAEQALFERLRLDGSLPEVRGDFLSVRSSNRGLSKIDALMQRTVAYDVTVDPDRNRVRATVSITVENAAPSSGLPSVVIGNRIGHPTGTNSATVSVYTPLELVDVTHDGEPIPRGAELVYGRSRYTALLDVEPGASITVVFQLEGPMDLRTGYHLDVVPQPLVNADRVEVDVHSVEGWQATGRTKVRSDAGEVDHIDVTFSRQPR